MACEGVRTKGKFGNIYAGDVWNVGELENLRDA
jgi:hypothetical protein